MKGKLGKCVKSSAVKGQGYGMAYTKWGVGREGRD